MPMMLHHHVPGTVQQRHDTYNAVDAAAVQAFRDAGGLVWIAHTEQHDIAQLRDAPARRHRGLQPPREHRSESACPYLGLDPDAAIDAAVQFADTTDGHPEPDLALFSLPRAEPAGDRSLEPAARRWARRARHCRQRRARERAADHARRRRARRFVSPRAALVRNIALVTDPQIPRRSRRRSRRAALFAVFELLGTPEGFDISRRAAASSATTVRVGTTLDVACPARPQPRQVPPGPDDRGHRLRGSTRAARRWSSQGSDSLSVPMAGAGAYRVEISIDARTTSARTSAISGPATRSRPCRGFTRARSTRSDLLTLAQHERALSIRSMRFALALPLVARGVHAADVIRYPVPLPSPAAGEPAKAAPAAIPAMAASTTPTAAATACARATASVSLRPSLDRFTCTWTVDAQAASAQTLHDARRTSI